MNEASILTCRKCRKSLTLLYTKDNSVIVMCLECSDIHMTIPFLELAQLSEKYVQQQGRKMMIEITGLKMV